jgi:LPPG:FO 2-phospho-L-lactate transferase
MKIAALAGGIGAGKFLRGVVRVAPPEDLSVIVNTGDDREFHGLWVSPDLDSVTYWLAGVMDRERGWGLAGETFRTTGELRSFGAPDAWFGLGDLDMATHLYRTWVLSAEPRGRGLSAATRGISARFGVRPSVVPMSDDRIATIIGTTTPDGQNWDLDFQSFWVQHGASPPVRDIRYEGADAATPAEGVLAAIEGADVILICPSNPIASIFPILAVPGIRETLEARRDRVVGISPIVGGAPVRGMADKLMPAAGYGVTAAEAARCYEGLLSAWVIDEQDRNLAPQIEATGVRVAVSDTMMVSDEASERIARVALDLL